MDLSKSILFVGTLNSKAWLAKLCTNKHQLVPHYSRQEGPKVIYATVIGDTIFQIPYFVRKKLAAWPKYYGQIFSPEV